MNERTTDIIVAGHICLDIIPSIEAKVDELFIPGKLVDVGPAIITTGGSVSNTGLALHRLGVPTKLMGKIGDDWFGEALMDALARYGDGLADGMIRAPGGHSSYTIAINPPGVDRIFLHCTGANDTFAASDVRAEALEGARLFHFGYPPLMRKMYEHDGAELASLLSLAKSRGLAVSLDMARPDPESDAGKADWRRILAKAFPFIDLFLPSFEEILYMLRRDTYDAMVSEHRTHELVAYCDSHLLSSLADEMIAMGAAIVVLKLGENGLYLKTTSSPARLAFMGAFAPTESAAAEWIGRELLVPCYEVQVAGTTRAGDCTIAGFLAGFVCGGTVEEVLHAAVGAGAHNVEKADATSGVPSWEGLRARLAAGWAQKPLSANLLGWLKDERTGVFRRG